MEWIKANLQAVNTSELRSEFLEEGGEPQTLAKGSQVIEIENEANEEGADVQEVDPNAISLLYLPLPHLLR